MRDCGVITGTVEMAGAQHDPVGRSVFRLAGSRAGTGKKLNQIRHAAFE
jgi:hypothetical protein